MEGFLRTFTAAVLSNARDFLEKIKLTACDFVAKNHLAVISLTSTVHN
jgi:hypothetical protein